jgi:hypothetical protein
MISYPGEIIERFGRYEAIEEIGSPSRAQLWRAWDPFLERFVLIAALPGLDPTELHRAMRNLDGALARWTDGKCRNAAQVLDFAPSGEDEPAFFVLSPHQDSAASEVEEQEASTPTRLPAAAHRDAEAPPARRARLLDTARRRPGLLAAIGVALLAAGLTTYVMRPAAPQPRVVPTELAPSTPPQATQEPGTRAGNAPNAVAVVNQMAAAAREPQGPAESASATPAGVALPEEQLEPARRAAPPEPQGREDIASKPAAPEARLEPPPGLIRMASGESREFAVKSEGGAGLRYKWQLDGATVEETARYRVSSDALQPNEKHALSVTASDWAGKTVASGLWTLAVAVPNRPPVVSLSASAHEVNVGERLIVKARFRSAEGAGPSGSEPGDRFECEWAVNGQPKQRFCEELEWQVPQEASPGPVKIALTARERRGLATTQELTVTVRQPPVAPASAEAAAAPPPSGATAGAAVRSQPEAPPVRALDDKTAAQQAIEAYFKRFESQLRAQPRTQEASVHFQVDRIELQGEHGNATGVRTVELPDQPPQSVQRTLGLHKQNGAWTVEERK